MAQQTKKKQSAPPSQHSTGFQARPRRRAPELPLTRPRRASLALSQATGDFSTRPDEKRSDKFLLHGPTSPCRTPAPPPPPSRAFPPLSPGLSPCRPDSRSFSELKLPASVLDPTALLLAAPCLHLCLLCPWKVNWPSFQPRLNRYLPPRKPVLTPLAQRITITEHSPWASWCWLQPPCKSRAIYPS